jgi:hypothetical protein
MNPGLMLAAPMISWPQKKYQIESVIDLKYYIFQGSQYENELIPIYRPFTFSEAGGGT